MKVVNLENMEFHFIGVFSTAKESLRRAKSIIELAEKNPKEAGTLAACVTILLAAALEQAVETSYDEAAKTCAFEGDIAIADTEPAKYQRKPVWVKVQSLPSVRTGDKFRLRLDHKLSKSLRELPETRNRLMHVNEPAVHLIAPSDNFEVVDGIAKITFTQYLSGWLTMKLATAKNFYEAVDVYFREVLDPESSKINEGTIVCRTVKH